MSRDQAPETGTLPTDPASRPRPSLRDVLGDEGFRLFFLLGAAYAALWPLQWVLVFGFDLPLARTTPPGLWHVHEMVYGVFGAALIGFLTTALPEWTDTPRPRAAFLFPLAALWGGGRLVGFGGADALGPLGGVCDVAWLVLLATYGVRVAFIRRSTRYLAFVFWVAALAVADGVTHFALAVENATLARHTLQLAGLGFLGLLGLALARITLGATNQLLDPAGTTSPYRPHPGRLNLAPGLVALAVAGDLAGFSPAIEGYLLMAAGAAFMDRVAEWFVGREALRAELAALGMSSLLAGLGLLMIGLARLGAPVAEIAGWHVALMGGLGLGVLAVFSIAGLLHAGRPLAFARSTRLALGCLVGGVALRVLPDLGLMPHPPGPPYGLAVLLWSAAFALWIRTYWPILTDADSLRGEATGDRARPVAAGPEGDSRPR